jgi:hypothetical protein
MIDAVSFARSNGAAEPRGNRLIAVASRNHLSREPRLVGSMQMRQARGILTSQQHASYASERFDSDDLNEFQ